tara:strand:+ start:569 stop:1129 length:561 start_codon:yes stop_codon:yes gene_type:complete
MRKFLTFLPLMLTVMLWTAPAKADLLSVHADIPLSFSPTQEGADTPDSISGARVGLSLFILPLGIAYESFEVSYSSDSVDSKDTYQIASVFVNLPVPVINIALGAGAGMVIGEDEKKDGTKLTADDSAATSFFATLGYPVLPLFDVHVGYQVINANKADVKNPSGGIEYERDPSGTVWTAGIKIGF